MKNQALFSSKDKSKTLKCHLLQLLLSALRVKKQISSHGSKFFPLGANPMTGRLHSTGRHVWINTASDKRGY